MNINLYWPIFKNLENELLKLSNEIHFDDDQLDIYSSKITELLIRTVVEVESISKELYFLNGGAKPNDNELFFDTDCIALLESKWVLSKKKVLITSPNFYFQKEENQVITPLKKANKRGTSSADWLKAYQAVKHNRVKELKKGNLKYLIRALAGLYVLNTYFREVHFDLKKDGTGTNFNSNLGSEIFSIKTHINRSITVHENFPKNLDFEECIYIIKPTDDTREFAQNSIEEMNAKTKEKIMENVMDELHNRFKGIEISSEDDFKEKTKKFIDEIGVDYSIKIGKENAHLMKKAFEGLRYEGVLNKNQY